jgi:hypothetical protein
MAVKRLDGLKAEGSASALIRGSAVACNIRRILVLILFVFFILVFFFVVAIVLCCSTYWRILRRSSGH